MDQVTAETAGEHDHNDAGRDDEDYAGFLAGIAATFALASGPTTRPLFTHDAPAVHHRRARAVGDVSRGYPRG